MIKWQPTNIDVVNLNKGNLEYIQKLLQENLVASKHDSRIYENA